MRSAIQPHICRLTNAEASSTDSIAAPCAGLNPRSVQKETRCAIGSAIATQQRKIASDSSPSTIFGASPSTRPPGSGPAPKLPTTGAAGGALRKKNASGSTSTTSTAPNATMVQRQPICSIARSNTEGQIAPADRLPAAH